MIDPFDLSVDEALRLAKAPDTSTSDRIALMMHPSPLVAGVAAERLAVPSKWSELRAWDPVHDVARTVFFEWRFDFIFISHFEVSELALTAARNTLARDAHCLLDASAETRLLALLLLRVTPRKFWNRWSVRPKTILKSPSLKQQRFVVAAWSTDRPQVVGRIVLNCLTGRRKVRRLYRSPREWQLFQPKRQSCHANNWYVAAHLNELSHDKAAWDAFIDEVLTGAPEDCELQSNDAYTLLMPS